MFDTYESKEKVLEELEQEGQPYCCYENKNSEWILGLYSIFYKSKKGWNNYRKYDLRNKVDINIKTIGKDFKCLVIDGELCYICVLGKLVYVPYILNYENETDPYSIRLDFETFSMFMMRKILKGAKVERIR